MSQILPPYAPSTLYPPLAPSAPPANEEPKKPSTDEKVKEFLSEYDFFILIDRSSTMNYVVAEDDETSRWSVVKDCLHLIVKNASELDQDGVDVCFFGTQVTWHEGIESAGKVDQLFQEIKKPRGETDLTEALEQTFHKHKKRKKKNPDQKSIVLVITDGKPDEPESVKKAIINFTNTGLSGQNIFEKQTKKETIKLTHEFGIRFFQVGDDEEATSFLSFLDKDLLAEVDIVCTGNIEELKSDKGVRKAFFDAVWAD